jgi:pimeloyl-ACP methyl ester carboxylesterase
MSLLETAKSLCSTDVDVDVVVGMGPSAASPDALFAVLSTPPRSASVVASAGHGVELRQVVALAGVPRHVQSAGVDALVGLLGDRVALLTPGAQPTQLFDVWPGARDVVFAVQRTAGTAFVVHVAAFVDEQDGDDDDPNKPEVMPDERETRLLVAHVAVSAERVVVSSPTVSVNDVTSRSERLAISGDGSQVAWAVMKNTVPEEAERGDVYTCQTTADAPVRALTDVGGRVSHILLTHSGRFALFGANFSAKRPITTRMQLWLQATRDAAPARAVLPSMADEQCEDFDFVVGADGFHVDELCVTHVVGVLPRSQLVRVETRGDDVHVHATPLADPVAESSGAPVHLGSGALAFVTESETALPTLCIGAHRHALPQNALFGGMRASHFVLPTSDGHSVTAMFFTHVDTPKSAPLLVHVVGGPSVTSRSTLRAACAMTRYPYRALLTRGFHIVTPMYRGKLGFGDKFAGLCIGNQGVTDLRDIMETIAATKDRQLVSVDSRLGIFGGSYGGYMTMRAMSAHPCTFVAGVAEYGFVSSKFICAEVGDFTWDQEYWPDEPVDQPNAKTDLWPYTLHNIERPVLFTHGREDPICPVSQSKVAYRLLHQKGVPTQLVIYPNEGHGYSQPAHMSDRAKRILQWFNDHFKFEN